MSVPTNTFYTDGVQILTTTDGVGTITSSTQLNSSSYTTGALTTTWDTTHNTIFNARSLKTNINPQILAVEKAVLLLNDNTTPTASIGIEADNSGGVGTYFGMNLFNNNDTNFGVTSTMPYQGSVVFDQEGAGATTTQTAIKQGTITVSDTATTETNVITKNGIVHNTTGGIADFSISSNGNILMTADNLDLSATRLIMPSLASANYMDYNTGNLTVVNNGVGGLADPQLLLTNSNASINTIPTIEMNKTGRNLTTGENVGSISMYGLDAGAQKTEFARIQVKAENVAVGNEDGTLSIFNAVNGASLEVFNFNGGQNENNTFRPMDMNGNALRSNTGNLILEATNSVGTGDILLNPKVATGFIKPSKDILTDNAIKTLTNTGSVIDFAGASPDNKFDINEDKVELYWNDAMSDQSQLILDNDYASKNNTISQFYQSASGNIQTLSQAIPSIHRFQQLDSINARTSELSPAKLELNNSAKGTNITLDNNFALYENKLTMNGSDTSSLPQVYTSAQIVNRPTNQLIQLASNNSGTSNTKTLTLINETSTSSSLAFNNQIDTNPFNITSNTDLNITSGNDLEISSANDIDILATGAGMGTRNVNITASGGVNLTTSSSLTMAINNDLILTGSSMQSSSAGGTSGQHLRILLNGTYYKIKLEND